MRTDDKVSEARPVQLLFGDYHLRLLSLFLMQPERAFHLREVQRLTEIPVGALHREMKRFEGAGIVTSRRVGNQVHYQADRTCPIFPELQGIVRKTTGLADVLREALAPLADRVQAAVVYGSIAAGTERASSDVDLLVVGDVSFSEVVNAVYPCHERLGREVNTVVLSPGELTSRIADGQGFIERVLAGPRIAVMGELDVT